ncbi:somatostatin receptor type 2-like [Oculina patagonica]
MDTNETSWLSSNNSGNISSRLDGRTAELSPMYVFTPVDVIGKRLLCIILATIGSLGFLGNCLLLYFLWKKPKRNPIQRSLFMRNFNLYVRSMSLSDILSCVVSLPLLCIQISFDVFQSGWACKVVRYFNFIFPAITINCLVVISLEKYLSTRSPPRTFSAATVRKMIIGAWVFGIFFVLLPTAPYDGIRVDLNKTHYTVICRYDQDFYPFRMVFILIPVQYILPSVFITCINICLMKTVWDRGSRQVGNVVNNAFKAKMIATRIKGISLLITITFAFILTYLFYLGNVAYTLIAQPNRDFSTDFIMRYATGGIGYLNCVINVIIYFVQMNDFREFLKKLLCRCGNANNQVTGSPMDNHITGSSPMETQTAAKGEAMQLKTLNPRLNAVDNVRSNSV